MIEVVGKQKRVETPSRFRISAITFITSIVGSSRVDRIECSFNRSSPPTRPCTL
jgi:hypothetical protein